MQAKTIAEINKSLFSILSRAIEEPDSIDRSMREIDPLTFSQDRSWRDIIKALNEGNEEFNPIRMTALTKYIKYLSSLQDIIGYICTEKKQSIGAPVDDDKKEMREFEATWALDEMDSESGLDSQTKDKFERLPKCKEVSVKLPPGGRLDVRLASYKFQLVATDDNVQFIDNNGVTILNKGNNIIGRGGKSTIKVDVTQKDVSRTHLHIFISDDHTLLLTDLSSAGTFITTVFLK
ncbi:MAG: FHA domain-containing protein [Gammaproteobacteria bacterium]|nr:FHA domain-containing protein [Gammaproteobacteria bacterium]